MSTNFPCSLVPSLPASLTAAFPPLPSDPFQRLVDAVVLLVFRLHPLQPVGHVAAPERLQGVGIDPVALLRPRAHLVAHRCLCPHIDGAVAGRAVGHGPQYAHVVHQKKLPAFSTLPAVPPPAL